MVDALVSGTSGREAVGVRISPSAPIFPMRRCSSVVERTLGMGEVESSILSCGSRTRRRLPEKVEPVARSPEPVRDARRGRPGDQPRRAPARSRDGVSLAAPVPAQERLMGCSQVVRQRFLVPCIAGSNPATPAIHQYRTLRGIVRAIQGVGYEAAGSMACREARQCDHAAGTNPATPAIHRFRAFP